MPQLNLLQRTKRAVCLLFALVLLSTTLVYAASPDIVISQVFGGGGNSGSTLKNDYVELFNRSANPVDVTGWSLQYSSKAGVGTIPGTGMHTLTGTIQPGHYFLVIEAKGTAGTTDLPTPDFTPTAPLALSGTDGKIFLVRTATALTLTATGCPTSADVVDFVGFGAANCAEGTPTGVLSSVNAAIRTNSCVDTDNNSADFTVTTAAPRNSASPTTTCAASTPPSGTGAANPATVDAGSTTLLTVAVTPGANPASTGLTVKADLTAIGGSATQTLYDDGTNGDLVGGDNTFSFLATVNGGTSAGPKTLSVTIADSQVRTGAASINVAVTVPTAFHAIHEIQGNGDASPLVGQMVRTSGVVTSLTSSGFYLEAPDVEQDSDPATSEGIYVYTTSAPAVAVGDTVQVNGTVSEYGSGTITTTEITAPAITVQSHGNPLPTAVDVVPSPSDTADQLERYEGMRVHIANPKVVGPTGGSTSSDGVFYITAGTVPRPFREKGLEPGVALPTGMPANVPQFDGNPELVRVDLKACSTAVPVAVGDTLADITAPLSYSSGSYTLAPCQYTVTSTTQAVPLPDRNANEFTVASFNMLNFTNDANRLNKASLAIRNILKTPDIIGVEEMKDLVTLQALASKIASDGGPTYGAALLGNDGSQNVGVLYRTDRVDVSGVQEVGDTLTMPSSTGSSTPMFDRPPLVVTAKIKTADQPFPVTVFVNHLRSLIDVDKTDATGDFVRRKRQACAEALATFLSQHQGNNENVISVGDYNAFEFNDGYVDVLGTIKGQPTPADQVLLSSADLVDPDLVDLVTTMPAGTSYSYVENGNAQTLDHVVVTSGLLSRAYHFEVGHLNADFPTSYGSDATRPERVSDHDVPVAYFTLPSTTPTPIIHISPTSLDFSSQVINTTSSAQTITIGNTGNADLTISNIEASAEFTQTNNCTTVVAGSNCTISVTFTPITTGAKSGTVTVSHNASETASTIALTGTGTPVPAPIIGVAPSTLDFGSQVINTTSSAKTITVSNTGNADLTISNIAASAEFTQTNNCTTVVAGSNCTINVTFTPTTIGAKTGSITVTNNASETASTIALTGTGAAVPTPIIGVSPTTLAFAGQLINTTSNTQAITVSNTGNAALTISSIAVSGTDAAAFLQTNNCTSVAAGSSCTINVSFKPTATGAKSGTVTITHNGVVPTGVNGATSNATAATTTIALTGTGTDFALAPPTGGSTTQSVSAGQTATYSLQIAGTAGATGTVTFACSGAPDKTTCTVAPTSATLNGTTSTTVTVTVATTAPSTSSHVAGGFQSTPGPGRGLPLVLVLSLAGFGAIVIVARNNKRQLRFAGACAALAMVVALSSCGGTKATPTTVPGTTAGNYTLTVTATSGAVSHTTSLTLTVN